MRRDWWGSAREAGPFGPFAFGARSRFFGSGEVRLAILSLLSEEPKHGYQLMKEMEERSGGLYRASAGSVYPTLQQLEDEGLIESDRADGKKTYRLTEAGRQELGRDPDAVRKIWERAQRWEDWGNCMAPETLAFVGPLAALAKATMRAAMHAAGKPDLEEQIRAILNRAKAELEEFASAK